MASRKLRCELCGKSFTMDPGKAGEVSTFATTHGNFCVDWFGDRGKNPRCWERFQELQAARVAAERGRPENLAKYWLAHDASDLNPDLPRFNGLGTWWELLSDEQRAEVSAEHDRRREKFRDNLPFQFAVGDSVEPFGSGDESYSVMCRMRCSSGNAVQDMYYASWESPQNSGEDPQYEELLLIHRRPDYGQSPFEDQISVVTLKERRTVLGRKLVEPGQMLVLDSGKEAQ